VAERLAIFTRAIWFPCEEESYNREFPGRVRALDQMFMETDIIGGHCSGGYGGIPILRGHDD